jgi:hypothetical protein
MYIFVIKLFYVFKYNLFLYQIEFISNKKYRNFNDWKQIIVMYIKTAYNRSDTVRYGQIRSDTVGYGQIRSDTVRYGQIRSDTVRYGRIRSDTVGYGYEYGMATVWLRYGYGCWQESEELLYIIVNNILKLTKFCINFATL